MQIAWCVTISRKKVETAFMTMNDDVTGRISTKTVKVKCTSLLERGNPLVLMFEIIDHKDFATVRLMDGGSQMQFGMKKLVSTLVDFIQNLF